MRKSNNLVWLAFLLLSSAACGSVVSGGGDAVSEAPDGQGSDIASLSDAAPGDSKAASDSLAATDAAPAVDTPIAAADVPKSDAGCTEPGCSCQTNQQCDSGFCIEAPTGQKCASLCNDKCDAGFKCAQVTGVGGDVQNICVPAFPRICEPCSADSDCNNVLGGADSRCVPYKDASLSLVGNFCGTKCIGNVDCAPGYSCKQVMSLGGIKGDQCVKDDLVCNCDGRATKLQLVTGCSSVNAAGSCGGKRTCSANGLSACDAGSAALEQCNQKDDDCDGLTDESGNGLCDDSQSCTYDNCVAGECQHPAKTGDCDDGSACTTGDECTNGKCLGKSNGCDDKNPCTADSCDAKLGCKSTADDSAKCSDNNVCTENDACKDGVCVAGSPKACDDTNPCTTDSCSAKNGCVFSNNDWPCSDGDFCTMLDVCKNGSCSGTGKLPCSDGNPCTDDTCDSKTGCQFNNNTAICSDGNACTEGDACKDGTCKSGAYKSCDDNSVCTEGDACKDGKCVAGSAKNCNDGNVCTTDLCDSNKGCIAVSNGDACDDNNVCTSGDVCVTGKCMPGKGKVCNDGNPCTDDFCDPTNGCSTSNNLSTCNDTNLCTTIDVCKDGICSGSGPLLCDDGNACTDDSCDKLKGCKHAANSGPCSDGSECTLNDVCKNAACTPGPAKECDDSNTCTTDACDAVNGCFFSNNAMPCSDKDACTLNDTCSFGSCIGGEPPVCDDGNGCTDDSCDKFKGCKHAQIFGGCNDGNACSLFDQCKNSICTPGAPKNCDDGKVCTTDTCDPVLSCQNVNNSNACDDGTACTNQDACANSLCAGKAIVCDDGNPCTTDSCDKFAGCQVKVVADNQDCSVDGKKWCKTGVCIAKVFCGDGVVNQVSEDCDDGNLVDSDACSNLCKNNISVNVQFTTCGATGLSGPSQGQCDNAYPQGNGLFQKVTLNSGIQQWTVPVNGNYQIETFGASGGDAPGFAGGAGARMKGTFALNKGDILQILVGQAGLGSQSSGGGGGTFVALGANVAASSPLCIAGGGGGGRASSGVGPGAPGVVANDGTASAYAGGTAGNGGQRNPSTVGGFAGGGFKTSGLQNAGNSGKSGFAFILGGSGGVRQDNGANMCQDGGFGGGGGGMHNQNQGSGGGGGYSGGGAGHDNAPGPPAWGGGGGSYNSGINVDNSGGVNVGPGKVNLKLL